MKYSLNLEDNQIVIYFDILGFSQMILNNEDTNMDTTGDIVANIELIFKRINSELKIHNVKTTWISDSIFISGNIVNINEVFKVFFLFLRGLLSMNFTLRGGIAIGKNYHQDNIWGPATIKAVRLEQNDAIYPRIIIREEDILKIKEDTIKNLFFRDMDNQFCIDYVKLVARFNDINFALILVYSKTLISGMKSDDPKIIEKNSWALKSLAQSVKINHEFIDNVINSYNRGNKNYDNIYDSKSFIEFLEVIK